ncbi:hypothetical protein [Methylobacterium oryzisoli]|uniref:hypothetical protein n=1 Tax=Methylobacterium oryzisoli TaxID=3385502 RepID=UPI0038921B7B
MFDSPPDQHDDSGFAAGEHRVDATLRAMQQQLEKLIFDRPAAVASAFGDGPTEKADLIAGVGIGPAHRDFESVGPAGPGAPVLNVYVTERMSMDEVKAACVDSFGVRALSSDTLPINVIHTGPIDALANRLRVRLSPCGVSVAHPKVTAGTQGVLARGRSGPRANRLLLISNNHVIANSNDARAGDPILQPGPADGGRDPADRIAVLEQWVPITFAGQPNVVDCASAWCWPDRVRKQFMYRVGSAMHYFSCGAQPVPARVGLMVGKSGRTTQLTSGRVIDVSASIRVNYGQGQVANFRDQITIRGNQTRFSQGGDSGSLVWTWDAARRPVGLLFAGGGELTFANKIDHVLKALDVTLVT